MGRPRPNPWKGLSATSIDRRPVYGPVAVVGPGRPKGTGAVGLVGDRVYDVKHHGGSDLLAAEPELVVPETEQLSRSLLAIAGALGSVSALGSALTEVRRAVELFGGAPFAED